MLLAPLMNSVGIYWIAIELTTLVSTFLVAFGSRVLVVPTCVTR
jgi:formate hydrogenlyase subunit 3/multisubunit Na+/H+ antiporter MnhD subunit